MFQPFVCMIVPYLCGSIPKYSQKYSKMFNCTLEHSIYNLRYNSIPFKSIHKIHKSIRNFIQIVFKFTPDHSISAHIFCIVPQFSFTYIRLPLPYKSKKQPMVRLQAEQTRWTDPVSCFSGLTYYVMQKYRRFTWHALQSDTDAFFS